MPTVVIGLALVVVILTVVALVFRRDRRELMRAVRRDAELGHPERKG